MHPSVSLYNHMMGIPGHENHTKLMLTWSYLDYYIIKQQKKNEAAMRNQKLNKHYNSYNNTTP